MLIRTTILATALVCSSVAGCGETAPATSPDVLEDAGSDGITGLRDSGSLDLGVETTSDPDQGGFTSAPPRSACESFEVELKPDPDAVPQIMLVVDYSGSMRASGEWDRMTAALQAVTVEVDDVVHFGLVLFPDPRGAPNVCALGRLVVPPDARTANQIETQLAINTSPIGGTPTATTLEAVHDYFERTQPEGPNIVILATDGGPGCSADLTWPCDCIPDTQCQNADQNCFDEENTVAAVRALANDNIPTYVIGVPGSETVSDLLDRLARVGGTAVGGQHFAVNDEEELVNALKEAAGGVVPCRYELSNPPEDPNRVVLLVDGIDIARDRNHRAGWDLSEGTFIDLYGSVCRRLRDGAAHNLEVRYNCDI